MSKHYLRHLVEFGCVLCHTKGYTGTPAEIHHIRRFGGLRNDSPVIPLCPEHHRGNTGVHGIGRKAFEKLHKISEDDLLNIIIEKFGTQNG